MKIEINNVSKEFKKVNILNNVNMILESGNIYGFAGRNGSGKTLLLKIICAFYEPTTGEILFNGENIIKEKKFPPSTRALIEKPHFMPDLTGFENLKLLASLQNITSDEDILRSLELVLLNKDKDKKYKNYSLGMKQKLGIAQVLMDNPDIIILDEPFNGIEGETATKLRKVLKEEADKGKIIIIASHINEDLYGFVNKLYLFEEGIVREITKK